MLSRVYYGWVIVGVAFMMNIAASPTNAVAFSFFISPMSDDLGWSRAVLGWALLARLAVAGVTAPVLGLLVDRVGARLLGTAAGVIAGICLIALAFVHEVWLLFLLFGISGLSGFGGPAGQLLTIVPVSKWFVAQRGRALAIATVGMPLGTAILVPVIQVLISQLGWREAWAISGVFVLLLAVPACSLFMRKDPESLGLLPDGVSAPEAPIAASATTSLPVEPVMEADWTVQQVLRNRTFWTILLSIGLSGIVIQGTLVYRTPYWEDTGLGSGVIALGTALDPLTVVFSGLFFGFLAERVAIRYLGLIGGIGVALSMVPMVLASGSPLDLFAHNLIWGASMGANITVNNIIWPNYFGRRFLGTIRGIVFPVAVGTAAVSTPIFALLLASSLGDHNVWLVTLVAFLISGALIFTARPPRSPATVSQSEGQPATLPRMAEEVSRP